VVKLEVADAVVNTANAAWVADGTFNSFAHREVSAMYASKSDLTKLDGVFATGSWLGQLHGSCSEDFELFPDKNVKGVQHSIVFISSQQDKVERGGCKRARLAMKRTFLYSCLLGSRSSALV
jgi:hypothetical protein